MSIVKVNRSHIFCGWLTAGVCGAKTGKGGAQLYAFMDFIRGALVGGRGGCTCENPSRCKTCALRPLYKQRAREEPREEARRPLLARYMRFQCLADTLSLPCARRGFARPFFPVLPRLCSIQADMAAEVVLASSGISMPSACAMFLA